MEHGSQGEVDDRPPTKVVEPRGRRLGWTPYRRPAVLCTDLVDGFGEKGRPDIRPGGEGDDRGVRDAEALGHDRCPEVRLVPDDHVRAPPRANPDQIGRALAADP